MGNALFNEGLIVVFWVRCVSGVIVVFMFIVVLAQAVVDMTAIL